MLTAIGFAGRDRLGLIVRVFGQHNDPAAERHNDTPASRVVTHLHSRFVRMLHDGVTLGSAH